MLCNSDALDVGSNFVGKPLVLRYDGSRLPWDMMGNNGAVMEDRMFWANQRDRCPRESGEDGLYTAPPPCASGFTTGPSHT